MRDKTKIFSFSSEDFDDVASRADGTMRDADETIINEDMMPVKSTLNSSVSLR